MPSVEDAKVMGYRSERRGQKPLSTFHLQVGLVNFVYFGGHFDKFEFPGQTECY